MRGIALRRIHPALFPPPLASPKASRPTASRGSGLAPVVGLLSAELLPFPTPGSPGTARPTIPPFPLRVPLRPFAVLPPFPQLGERPSWSFRFRNKTSWKLVLPWRHARRRFWNWAATAPTTRPQSLPPDARLTHPVPYPFASICVHSRFSIKKWPKTQMSHNKTTFDIGTVSGGMPLFLPGRPSMMQAMSALPAIPFLEKTPVAQTLKFQV